MQNTLTNVFLFKFPDRVPSPVAPVSLIFFFLPVFYALCNVIWWQIMIIAMFQILYSVLYNLLHISRRICTSLIFRLVSCRKSIIRWKCLSTLHLLLLLLEWWLLLSKLYSTATILMSAIMTKKQVKR